MKTNIIIGRWVNARTWHRLWRWWHYPQLWTMWATPTHDAYITMRWHKDRRRWWLMVQAFFRWVRYLVRYEGRKALGHALAHVACPGDERRGPCYHQRLRLCEWMEQKARDAWEREDAERTVVTPD